MTLIGSVGQDPERKELNGGRILTKFSLATNRTYKDKNTGEKKTETQWHKIEAWNALGDTIATWVKKGQLLYVRGEIRYGKYEKDGITRDTVSIMANDFQMLGGKPERSAAAPATAAADSVRDYKTTSAAPEAETVTASSKDVMADDDDLPF